MAFIIFVYGLLIGSFLNVLIYRIPREESIAFPGSHCPVCSHKLRWYDNIPLISYLSLSGKCRYCGTKINLQYPLIEAANAFTYIFLYIFLGWSIDFVFFALISSVLIAIFMIDLKEQIIPDSLVLSILIIGSIHKLINYFAYAKPLGLLDSIIGLAIAGGLFLLIVIFSKGGMGGGDVTLIGALGFVLGVKGILLTIFLSFMLGAVISVFLLVSGIKSRKDPIPFGPFIILGFFITLLCEESIINWYFQILT
ncbi:prepilin peptidase [Gudongella oleilytica]|uniref:prepilin peptidase n=1 Tax=Gudongella oleilytica TaxID=1582259 RepID=UPI000FF8A3A5|nr:A24 family peptidase [Gudongella oleilytica]